MSPARRFVSLAILLFFAVPFGMSITGCKHALAVVYCNGGDSGPVEGQIATITLSPSLATYGESLNYGQIGQSLSASAQDCKGNSVSASSYTYASTDGYVSGNANAIYADINPATGQICAGTWNRNTGGGVPNYTTCTAPPTTPANYLAYVTATANGAVSNAIPVFIHAAPTSIAISTGSGSCLIGTTSLTGSTSANSTLVGVSSTTGLAIGQGITAPFIPSNTTIAAVNSLTNTLTISNAATETSVSTVSGSLVAGSPTVTVPLPRSTPSGPGTTGLGVGETITGTGIPANTTITAYDQIAGTLTLSNNATVSTAPTGTYETLTVKLNLSVIGNPTSNCCPLTYTAPQPATIYNGTSCLSQGQTGQLVASVYANGGTSPADNITCQVGHLVFSPVGATNIVTIDENGVATANQPGSATITASISNSGSASTAGFFSTCPPAKIQLTSNGSFGPIAIGLNNSQPFTAVVTDLNGNAITGLSLEYNSTSPQTIPTSSNTVEPVFPGTATITAVCQPGTCNPSPYSQINYLGNGTALTSNGVVVNAAGTSSTVLYMGSTSSQYLYPVDFTTNQPATLLKLPYIPNSMIINQSGTEIYLGSSSALMTVSTANNALASTNTGIVGQVISVSPDGSTIVVTDSSKDTISLINTSGAVITSYGGVATHASWSPDSQTVYITTTTSLMLVHNAFTSWTAITALPVTTYTDVVATVPHYGAFFAGGTETDGRTYCPTTTLNTAVNPAVATNSFYPVAETAPVPSDRLAATTNGAHILSATASTTPATLTDMVLPVPTTTGTTTTITPANAECPLPGATPITFTSTNNPHLLTGVTATSITGIDPSTNSNAAFVTYIGAGAGAAAGTIPLYAPTTGTLSFVALSGTTPGQPVAGVWSDDDLTFYTGTSGDAKVHEIGVTYSTTGVPTASDNGTLTPNLPDVNGNIVTPNLLVQRPKKSTN
jgi:trimeric autotransporter adhesin